MRRFLLVPSAFQKNYPVDNSSVGKYGLPSKKYCQNLTRKNRTPLEIIV